MKRQTIVSIMQNWIGACTGSPLHKNIIDIYNSNPNGLPRGFKMTYTAPWCAATVTAAFIKAGYTKILPGECSCGKMIEQLKILGEWCEADSYIPKSGDLIFFSWTDPNPTADNTEGHDHVGIVEFVSDGIIHTIEGNYSGSVRRRTIKVNGKYIRGFGIMKYDEDSEPVYYKAVSGDTVTKLCQMFGLNKNEFIDMNSDKVKAPLYWLYVGKEYRIR